MLGQFTWGQFLCCYGAVSLLWYLGLLFTAYRKEALGLLGMGEDLRLREGLLKFKSENDQMPGNKPGSGQAVKGDFRNGTVHTGVQVRLENATGASQEPEINSVKNIQPDKSEARDHDLMGKAKLQQGMERVESGTLAFAPAQKDNSEADQVPVDEVYNGGLYEDLIAGIREIYEILAANDGNKQDFFGMVTELKAQFGRLGSSPCIARVNDFIKDSAPFAVNQEELESLWN